MQKLMPQVVLNGNDFAANFQKNLSSRKFSILLLFKISIISQRLNPCDRQVHQRILSDLLTGSNRGNSNKSQ